MTQNACLPDCVVARFLTLLNGPWATLVVRELLQGPRRFTELREALSGISPHTLTSRLRQCSWTSERRLGIPAVR